MYKHHVECWTHWLWIWLTVGRAPGVKAGSRAALLPGVGILYIYDIHMSHIQYMKIYNTFFISTHIYMSMVKKNDHLNEHLYIHLMCQVSGWIHYASSVGCNTCRRWNWWFLQLLGACAFFKDIKIYQVLDMFFWRQLFDVDLSNRINRIAIYGWYNPNFRLDHLVFWIQKFLSLSVSSTAPVLVYSPEPGVWPNSTMEETSISEKVWRWRMNGVRTPSCGHDVRENDDKSNKPWKLVGTG